MKIAFGRAARPRVILRSVFVLALAVTLLLVSFLTLDRPQDIVDLKKSFASLGPWAPVYMIALQTLGTLLLIPSFLLVVGTAYIFELDSLWINLVGQMLGALAAYVVARVGGRDILHGILGQRIFIIERLLEERGFQYLLYMRLMAFIPMPLLAYGPGLVRVPIRPYLLASFLGTAPFVIVLALFSDSLANVRRPSDFLHPIFLLPSLLLLLLMTMPIVGAILLRRRQRRREGPEASGADAEP